MQVLVTGATGGVGGCIVQMLARDGVGVRVRAISRNPERRRLSPDVEVFAADLDEPATLARALDGVDAVFLYAKSDKLPELTETLRRAGVRKVVVLSTIDATSDRPYAQYNKRRHLELEEAVAGAGFDFTCLRPGAFARNAARFWARSILDDRRVRLPFPDAEQSPIDDRDIAAVAVRALTSNDLDGQRIVLTGPESLSQRRQIELIGAALGQSIAVEKIPESEAREALGLVVPPAYVDLLMAQWQDEVGVRSLVTDAVERITGRAPTAYGSWAQRNVQLFAAMPDRQRRQPAAGLSRE